MESFTCFSWKRGNEVTGQAFPDSSMGKRGNDFRRVKLFCLLLPRGKSLQHFAYEISHFQRDFCLRRTRFLLSDRDFQRFLKSDLPLGFYLDIVVLRKFLRGLKKKVQFGQETTILRSLKTPEN